MTIVSRTLAAVTLFAMFPAICVGTANAATHHYVVANNTFSGNTASLYEVSDASLALVTTVPTGGTGSGGGYFVGATQPIARDGANICLFAADASSLDISAMKVVTEQSLFGSGQQLRVSGW